MRKTKYYLLILILFFSAVGYAQSASLSREGMLRSLEIQELCADATRLSCLGTNKKQCESASSKCTRKLPESIPFGKVEYQANEVFSCIMKAIDVSGGEMDRCDVD